MKVLDVVPEKVHVVFDLPMEELLLLQKALQMCQFNYSGTSQEDMKIRDFFINSFTKTINETIKELIEE